MILTVNRFNVLKRLVRHISCKSCGIDLQSKTPEQVGYFTQPKEVISDKSLISIEELKYLMFSQGVKKTETGPNSEDISPNSHSGLETPKRLICRRCNEALSRNKYDPNEFQNYSFDEVKGILPHVANVYHVVSLNDFPLSLDKTILADKNNTNYLLLSKADQITHKSAMLPHKGSMFFSEFCKHHIGVNIRKVVLFSSSKNWNIPSVLNSLAKRCYLLGSANVGKSSLINSLLLKKINSYQLERNRNGQILGPIKGIENVKSKSEHLKLNQAGVSHIPNFTRAMQTYQIEDIIVNDLPGYTKSLNAVNLSNIIEKDTLDEIRKTSKFKIEKLIKMNYITAKGTTNGRCLSFGGVFHLIPPSGSINQVINMIPLSVHDFTDVDKAIKLSKEVRTSENHPLSQFFVLKKQYTNKESFARHIIPPFQGSIEVVLKDIGYFLVKPTGKYSYNGLYELWVPEGIEVCIREPLSKLIDKSFEKYLETKEKSDLCPRDRPLVSNTYIMDHDVVDTFSTMREIYLDRTKNDLLARRMLQKDPNELVSSLQSKPPNLYWYYKW